MSFSLKIECDGGTEILDASLEAIRLANFLGITVEFEFNGVTCLAIPGGNAEALARNWSTELSKKYGYKIATSHERY